MDNFISVMKQFGWIILGVLAMLLTAGAMYNNVKKGQLQSKIDDLNKELEKNKIEQERLKKEHADLRAKDAYAMDLFQINKKIEEKKVIYQNNEAELKKATKELDTIKTSGGGSIRKME